MKISLSILKKFNSYFQCLSNIDRYILLEYYQSIEEESNHEMEKKIN